jgi:sulfide:quinone oxidoreductase
MQPRIAVLGAGLGGLITAYELRHALGGIASISLIGQSPDYWFVPSNPWVAVRWRKPEAIKVHLPPIMNKLGISFTDKGAKKVDPKNNSVELMDGSKIDYDYLVIATGPQLAFDEIEGLGPDAHTASICETAHADKAAEMIDKLIANPGPVIIGATQGVSCFGPAYEFAMIVDTELRKRKMRDKVPMTFFTPEPYVGHLGLDGVGDTKGLLESEMRKRHIKWVTNARVTKIEANLLHGEEVAMDGSVIAKHELPFNFAMLMPPFRGVDAVMGVEGLINPRGFILSDRKQQNPNFPNVFSVGVCVAIPPMGKTAVPVGVPKTGFMIESMATAVTENIKSMIKGEAPTAEASWNAICLADFGDGGVAFFAEPQLPPRNRNTAYEGKWVHFAKIAFEHYFLAKIKRGVSEPFFETWGLRLMGMGKLNK